MQVLLVIGPFLVLGIIVAAIAFAGSPGAAREAYLTRGGRAFTLTPSSPLPRPRHRRSGRGDRVARRGRGRRRQRCAPSRSESRGARQGALHRQTCKSCHNLDAVQARGVTGPDLDELGGVDKQRVLNAIKNGGTGQNRMPAGLLQGQDAQDVAAYVAQGRRPVAHSAVTESPGACGGFSVRRVVCAASSARQSKPRPHSAMGRGGPRWPRGRGRIEWIRVAAVRAIRLHVAQLFWREPVS